MLVFFFIILIVLIIAVLFTNSGSFSLSGADFFARGKELGLSSKEIKTLKATADILKLDKPLTIMGSTEQIDKAIISLNKKLEKSGYSSLQYIDLLTELYNFKKRSELKRSDKRHAITTSREIENQQEVKIIAGNTYPFIGRITEQTREYLIVDFSKDKNFSSNHIYEGFVNVYFWKREDAGYFFESKILDGRLSKRWKLSHSNSLIRNQKRQDIRVKVDIPGYTYKLVDISTRNSKPEGFTGNFVQIKNISDGGAAILTNGKSEIGTALKLEFNLLKKHVVLCGVLIDSQYNKKVNCSLLRLKFVEPELHIVSILRSFIYNLNHEQDIIKKKNIIKPVEKRYVINNNNNSDVSQTEEIQEVEYLTEDSEVNS